MAEVSVVKQSKPDISGFAGFPPPFRGNPFTVSAFSLMKQFTDELERVFTPSPRTASETAIWTPVIEVKEKDGKLVLTAELPGLKKEDVTVHVDGNALVVEGERKEEKEEKREGYYHSERSYGKFYRSILLPEGAKTEQTAAQFNNGVLEVTVPVPEAKAKQLNVPIQEPTKAKAA